MKTPRFCVYIESVLNWPGFDGGRPDGEMWRGGEQCACAKIVARGGRGLPTKPERTLVPCWGFS